MGNRAGRSEKTCVRCRVVTSCRVGRIGRNGSRCRHGMGYWVCKSCRVGMIGRNGSRCRHGMGY